MYSLAGLSYELVDGRLEVEDAGTVGYGETLNLESGSPEGLVDDTVVCARSSVWPVTSLNEYRLKVLDRGLLELRGGGSGGGLLDLAFKGSRV